MLKNILMVLYFQGYLKKMFKKIVVDPKLVVKLFSFHDLYFCCSIQNIN